MLSVILRRDILAIKSIEKYIIVGIGNELHVLNQSTGHWEIVINTFHQHVIHEIIRDGDKLIVFGGRNLSVFNFHIETGTIRIKKLLTESFKDWIIAANFAVPGDHLRLYILFAHNNLYFYDTLSKNHRDFKCEEKCILYSGRVFSETPTEALIFSGTVFQEILIWTVKCIDENISSEIPVLQRLRGHNGVIFSIFYDSQLHLISSTSDDRTVRLWKIGHESTEKIINWKNASINLITTIFGHTARVWKSIIVNNNIISIGEDSAIFIWTLDGKLCQKFIAHDGATVWSIDCSEDKSTIFTGGADGAVNSWPLACNDSDLISILALEKPKTPKYVSYLKSGALMVFTDTGELITYNADSNLPKNSIKLPQFESYCVIKVCPNRKKIALASKNGVIDVFEENSHDGLIIKEISGQILQSKILSIQWLTGNTLLACGEEGQLKVIEINGDKLEVKSEFTLPPGRERWTTAAIIVGNALICGDRAGSVYAFSFNSKNERNPTQTFPKIHGRLGVQSFEIIGMKMISTGRDAALRYYKILNSECNTTLQTLHWKKMPMEWVSRVLKTDNGLYVLGFKEIEFMIYSTELNRLVLRIPCGGGHRSWDCTYTNGSLNFACIRNKQIYTLKNKNCTFSESIIPGYHTKEIHCMEELPTCGNHNIFVTGSEDCTLRMGRVVKSPTNKYTFDCLSAYDGHISNVKCIAVVNLEKSRDVTRNLIFSGGGRAQLKVWSISVEFNGEKDLWHDNSTVVELASFMLLGTDRERRFDRAQSYVVDPETRFMDITAHFHPQNTGKIILFVACSDGYIRTFLYDINCHKIRLTCAIPYHNRCLMKVKAFMHEDCLILISMATDGAINLWSVNSVPGINDNPLDKSDYSEISNLKPFARWNAHQSGINSFDFKKNNVNEYFLVTGGDDNNLCLSVFTITNNPDKGLSTQICGKWNSTCFYTAQITGVKFIGDNDILSTAIDQRVILFSYSFTNHGLSVTLTKKMMTFISDIQGLTLFNPDNIGDSLACIYGQGLNVILIEDEHNGTE